MPQLSPMSWVMVISVFLVCLIFFAVSMWWLVEGKYIVSPSGGKNKGVFKKKFMKWGFGSSLLK
uniref:ATP synthase F0 subunit 8 n=1 Tax=Anodonta cygnea TaxID=47528 RepID=A0A343REU9_9BIVA|nr:ATP synthase F0 subunit 8 [Anodonta cygnea]ATY40658.1 ATP synthase F0 subunit 8 [Anodonta cygnea]QQV69673.1 ATP synthase F0 subunit 8 [Anodonta cygnea]